MNIYLDTNGWTALSEWVESHGISILKGHQYLFSSCVLDEIAVTGGQKAQIIANSAWRISNRKKLLDHLEMTVAEIIAFQKNEIIGSIYDDTDPTFFLAWKALRKHGLSNEFLDLLREQQTKAKGDYKSHLKQLRNILRNIPSIVSKENWISILSEMERNGEIGDYLYNILNQWGLLSNIPRPIDVKNIPYSKLPCTSSWVEYFLGMSFVSSFEAGKHTKPDLGDQVDFRHACYAGLADLYVTGDRRMTTILEEYVIRKKARIVNFDEFLNVC